MLFDYALDFDMPPNVFNESITWHSTTGAVPAYIAHLSNNGFHSGDPLAQVDDIGEPVELDTTNGPDDQGTMALLNLGELAVGQSVAFTLYIGLAPNSETAELALHDIEHAISAQATSGDTIGLFAIGTPTYQPTP
ncbi:hypothetical protein [Demequina sp. NBRC 110052]|uniref:hypothetical protein n=1 Tax=Demequina sp. NBRC 110052 TaxID=1570341 RepID=UPI00117E7412|nr:hypothetical protein [Demequina sp. NBRC 110052]